MPELFSRFMLLPYEGFYEKIDNVVIKIRLNAFRNRFCLLIKNEIVTYISILFIKEYLSFCCVKKCIRQTKKTDPKLAPISNSNRNAKSQNDQPNNMEIRELLSRLNPCSHITISMQINKLFANYIF